MKEALKLKKVLKEQLSNNDKLLKILIEEHDARIDVLDANNNSIIHIPIQFNYEKIIVHFRRWGTIG